jgi:hypothetical protein
LVCGGIGEAGVGAMLLTYPLPDDVWKERKSPNFPTNLPLLLKKKKKLNLITYVATSPRWPSL